MPHEQQRRRLQRQRPVNLFHTFFSAQLLYADDDAIWTLEFVNRSAFAQVFPILDDRKIHPRIGLENDALDFSVVADRHSRLIDDDGEAIERTGDCFGGGVDIGEIRMAIAPV